MQNPSRACTRNPYQSAKETSPNKTKMNQASSICELSSHTSRNKTNLHQIKTTKVKNWVHLDLGPKLKSWAAYFNFYLHYHSAGKDCNSCGVQHLLSQPTAKPLLLVWFHNGVYLLPKQHQCLHQPQPSTVIHYPAPIWVPWIKATNSACFKIHLPLNVVTA